MDKETVEFGLKEKVLQAYFLNRKQVHTWAVSGIVAGALLVGYLAAGPSDGEYVRAKEAFQKWKNEPAEKALAAEMFRSIRKIPGMERGLESEIAQTYLAQGLTQEGAKLAQQALARLEEISPLHAQFGEVSLFIERGEYQRALELSVALKEEMEKTLDSKLWKGNRIEGGSALYVCNLFRIACLQKQLHNGPGELAAWEEIKGLIEAQGEKPAAALLLELNFGSQKFSLSDYISQREKSIVY